MPKKVLYRSMSNNPYFNIAFEHWLFNQYEGEDILYLWCNKPSVIIGRFQNPWIECNLKAMEEKGVFLVRRESGGGAVYHDLSTAIFSFYSPFQDSNSETRNYTRLIKALKSFGIDSYQSSRNDLTVTYQGNVNKVSGHAFKKKGNVNLQHGTMLINTQLGELANYLTPNPKKLSSKGISSVRSRVINLKEINEKISVEAFNQALQAVFWQEDPYAKQDTIWVDESLLKDNKDLKKEFDNLQKKDWLLGQTPEFSHQFSETFDFGSWDVRLEVENLKIKNIYLFTDCLSVDFVNKVKDKLKNSDYTKNGLGESFTAIKEQIDPNLTTWVQTLESWFIENIS